MTNRHSWIAVIGAIMMLAVVGKEVRAEVRLPSIFGDNMVLQKTDKCPIWGKAAPGKTINIKLADLTATATADQSGAWRASIDTRKLAEGPHELSISGDSSIKYSNVLIGDVWFCSGQSNMEWPLQNTKNAAADVAEAKHPKIRLYTVAGAIGLEHADDVQGQWVECTPDSVPTFSAVGYFFGRELHQSLNVPIGLIDDSWGGTNVESWFSAEMLRSDESVRHLVDRIPTDKAKLGELMAEADKRNREWEDKTMVLDPGNVGFGKGWADPKTNTDDWKTMRLPQSWDSAGLNIEGVVWFRTTVQIPSAWHGKELHLGLGPIDDFDITYFNNVEVGRIGRENRNAYNTPRNYTIPANLVKEGPATIAVRNHDWAGDGGLHGVPSQLKISIDGDEKVISLAGDWKYKIEFEHPPLPSTIWSTRPPTPAGDPSDPNTPTTIFNGRVFPLIPYAIKGAIWYQGENNAGRAFQYRTLLPMLIRDWRARWGQGNFPFYIVQLANFMARENEPTDSEWAELREAQTLTARGVPNSGIAIITDVGEANDIHPRDKQTVGHRLAVIALARTYGQNIVYTGPVLDYMRIEANKIRLTFTTPSVGGGLVAKDGKLSGFAIAGEDQRFTWAEATIEGNDVIVTSSSVKYPVAVRYDWANNPPATLYNKEGLPAGPFRTDTWKMVTADRK